MPNPKLSRKMQSVVKRSLLCSCVLIVIVVCLTFGVLGKSVPENDHGHDQRWYEGKELKLVHVVSGNQLNNIL